MTPERCAEATTDAFSGVASHFMLDGATYAKGAALGFSGIDFYAIGRAGVLDDPTAEEVTARFGFFEPGAVAGWLESAGAVMSSADAVTAFLGCGYDWADAHLGDGVDWDRVNELLGRLIADAPAHGRPLFAAWRAATEPDRGPKALALHRFNVLRELRNEVHIAALAEAGLPPLEALALKSPGMAPLFGWSELPETNDETVAKQARAEELTNEAMAPVFAGLSDEERDELVALCQAAVAAVS